MRVFSQIGNRQEQQFLLAEVKERRRAIDFPARAKQKREGGGFPLPQFPAGCQLAVAVRLTVCGLPGALSLMLRVPVNVPAPFDENVTLIVQLAPMARLFPQLLVCENLLEPLRLILLIRIGAVPVFCSVTDFVWLVLRGMFQVSDVGDRFATGCTPVPVSDTVCGLVGSPSLMLRVAVRTPVVDGVNVTLIEQLRPADRLPPIGQLFACANELAFVPPMEMLLIVSGASPTLVSVIVWRAEVVPTS